MATHRVIHEDEGGTPTPVSTSICSSFSAAMGAQVTFTGVEGMQAITHIPGTIWPFNIASPMTVPNPATIRILGSGLQVGTTYSFSVSQACTEGAQKGVTITDVPLLKEHRK